MSLRRRLFAGWFFAAGIISSCYAQAVDKWPDSVYLLIIATIFFSWTLRQLLENDDVA